MSASQSRAVIAAERRARALQLRKEGANFDQIAEELGMSRSAAHKTVQRAIAELATLAETEVAELRALESARLDELHQAVWPQAVAGDLPALDRVIRIMERRARLLGLDAPAKVASTNPEGTEEGTAAVIVVPAELGLDEWLAEFSPAALPTPEDAPEGD